MGSERESEPASPQTADRAAAASSAGAFAPSAGQILALQRSAGNAAVARLAASGGLRSLHSGTIARSLEVHGGLRSSEDVDAEIAKRGGLVSDGARDTLHEWARP